MVKRDVSMRILRQYTQPRYFRESVIIAVSNDLVSRWLLTFIPTPFGVIGRNHPPPADYSLGH